jgi:Hemerythrin HHE cation binding domain
VSDLLQKSFVIQGYRRLMPQLFASKEPFERKTVAPTPTDAFDMGIVHRVFRSELHNAPRLIRDVQPGDIERSAIVGGHLNFIVAALQHHHAVEDELVWPKLRTRAPARAVEIIIPLAVGTRRQSHGPG